MTNALSSGLRPGEYPENMLVIGCMDLVGSVQGRFLSVFLAVFQLVQSFVNNKTVSEIPLEFLSTEHYIPL